MLVQHYFLLSPRLSRQLIWSRFINVHGKPGRNIPCDLHLEHLNRVLKTAVGDLGSNQTEASIARLGKCIGTMAEVLGN